MPVAHVLAEGQGQMGWKPPGPRAITAQQSLSGSDVENWREVGGAALHPTAGPAGPGSPSKLHSALWSGPDPVAGDTEAEAWEPCLTRAPGPALPAAQPRAQSVGAQRPSLPASCIRGQPRQVSARKGSGRQPRGPLGPSAALSQMPGPPCSSGSTAALHPPLVLSPRAWVDKLPLNPT